MNIDFHVVCIICYASRDIILTKTTPTTAAPAPKQYKILSFRHFALLHMHEWHDLRTFFLFFKPFFTFFLPSPPASLLYDNFYIFVVANLLFFLLFYYKKYKRVSIMLYECGNTKYT